MEPDELAVEETEQTDPNSDTDDAPTSETNAGGDEKNITNPKATIKIEGQEFEIEVQLAEDDSLLKTILQPHYASVENAAISREVKDGKLIVSIVKKAQPKGIQRV